MATTKTTASVIDPNTKSTSIGHLVEKFRNAPVAKPAVVAEALDTINSHMMDVISHLRSSFSVSVPLSINVLEYTLTANSLIQSAQFQASPSAVLFLILTEDNVGAHTIVWDSNLKGVLAGDITTTANKINLYVFFGRSDGNWWLVCKNLGL